MFKICKAEPQDVEEIFKYCKKVGSETDFLLLDENGMCELNQIQLENFISSFTNETIGIYALAKTTDAEKIIGSITLQQANIGRKKTSHIYNLSIAVLSEFHGKGIGKALMLTAIDHAKKINAERIILEVIGENTNAISLYKKLGFEHDATVKNYFKVGNTYADRHIMSLFLVYEKNR